MPLLGQLGQKANHSRKKRTIDTYSAPYREHRGAERLRVLAGDAIPPDEFLVEDHPFGHCLHVVWRVLFGILAWQLALGFLIAWIEHWSLGDGVYFTFAMGLTIGYADLVPHQPSSRFLAILVGQLGTVFTGLVVAIAVRALQTATDDPT